VRARRAALLLVAVFALLAGLPLAGASAAPAPKPVVVFVAIPGLRWSDVVAMPTLTHLAGQGSVGELSVKTGGTVTRCAAGILAVTAGNRTEDADGKCPILATGWPRLRDSNATSEYKTTIGLLGTSLDQAGVATIAVGPLAAPMLTDEDGTLPTQVPTVAAAVAVADHASAGAVIATLDPVMYDVLPDADRAPEARVADMHLAATVSGLPSGATVIVAGISDASSGSAHLHVLAISGPGWSHTELRSSAAGRAPYVQLIDIAPTIMSIEGVKAPSTVVGLAMQQSGASVPSVASFVDDDRHAVDQRTLGQRTFLVLGIATILLIVLTFLPSAGARVGARWLARLLAPAPVLVFVGNAFPWWRWGQPVYAVIVVGGAVAIAAAATLVASRKGAVWAAIVPLAATLVALVCDQLTGAHLQLSAPLGDDPLVAGRFSGVGNLDFSAIATSGLVLAGLAGALIGGRRGVITGAAIAGVAVVVDGAPQLGDDIGGVFALLPGAIVLVALLLQLRITWRRAVVTVVATAVVAIGVALADYSRPAASQTHVGRFVGQVLHGGAGTEIDRKLHSALATFGLTVGTFVAVVTVVAIVAGRRRIAAALGSNQGLRAGAIAASVTAVLGVCLNDSGITIAAMAVMVGFSAAYGAYGAYGAGATDPVPAVSTGDDSAVPAR
jgi:hypothetical protein